MYYIQKFRRHTEYIPNVWTPTLKIYCTVVLLRSHTTAVSHTIEHQSVSVTFLTNLNALSSVRGGQKIFHYFFRNSTVTKSLMQLIMKGPWNTGTTRRWIHHFWSVLEFSRPRWKLLWEHAALPKTLTSGVFQTFHFSVSHNKIPSH